MKDFLTYVKSLFASSYGTDKPKFFIWHPKGLSARDKKLLFKVDLFILTYACLAYFTKWLDQANLSNAYVSGMKEDLKMYGTEYNLASTCFSVGQILGPIPANLLLTWVPPRFLLPGMEFVWAILTIATYADKNANQVCSFTAHSAITTSSNHLESCIPFDSSWDFWKARLLWVSSMFLDHGIREQSLGSVPQFSPVLHMWEP